MVMMVITGLLASCNLASSNLLKYKGTGNVEICFVVDIIIIILLACLRQSS
jgi:hypothetical protein